MVEDVDQELGTRAALLGLAVFGDKAAKPALLANWGKDQWITLEASRAMGWCGVYDGVDSMLVLLKQSEKKNIQAWTARCLGEMFDRNQPSNLSRLTEGNSFAYPLNMAYGKWIDLPLKRDAAERDKFAQMVEPEFPGLDNPFLYWQKLPCSVPAFKHNEGLTTR